MKTKLALLQTFLFVLIGHMAVAQGKEVTGTVTSASDGQTLPGATVSVQGTSAGAVTDVNGTYSIEVEEGQTLVFSFIGMQDKEVTVGSENEYNVTLKQGVQLQETVVTALGISREKKTLGYAVQEIEGEAVSEVQTDNFVNRLSGKIAGVNIKQNNNFGGSTNIVIRGYSSLLGNNQALFVVDGIPMSNANFNNNIQQQGGSGYDFGNAISDINPNEIKNINVLKGAAATALYGSRGANGVVLVTTKGAEGESQKGIGIDFSTNYAQGYANKNTFPEYQNQYGAGYGPIYPNQTYWLFGDDSNDQDDKVVPFTEDASFGAEFDPNLNVYHYDAYIPESDNYHQPRPWVMADNGPFEFFETATKFSNNVAFYGNDDRGQFRASYGNVDQTGILPNSEINRHNVGFNGSFDILDNLTVSANANYVNQKTTGRNGTGYNANLMSNFRQWWETNVDINQQEHLYDITGRNATWNRQSATDGNPLFWNNPYFQRYESYTTDRRDRIYGSAGLKWGITDKLSLSGRMMVDTYSQLIELRRAIGSKADPFGLSYLASGSGYSRQNVNSSESNFRVVARYEDNFGEDFSFSGLIGSNIRRETYNNIRANTLGGLNVEGLFALSNAPDIEQNEDEYRRGVNGYFANASVGYQGFLFLEGSIRNDVSSTLPEDNNSYVYPSGSISFLFSEIMDVAAIDLGKLRFGYAQVGFDAPVQSLNDFYDANIPFGNAALFSLPNTKNNSDLKPERQNSFEAGLRMQFLDNRIGFDVAYYNNRSIDAIIPVAVSNATGYESKYVNAGEVENKGWEVQLFGTPVNTEAFRWDLTLNWSRNRSEVISLFEGVDNLQLGSFQGGITINARVGEPYGTIQGTDYDYYENTDQPIVSAENGEYAVTSTTDNVLGSITPDWRGGINSTFTFFGNLSLRGLIDIKQGGQVFSLDQWYGRSSGLYPETAFTNDLGNPVRNDLSDGGGYINEGVNPNGEPNTTRVNANSASGFGYATNPNAAFVYDASYVKLREVAITYRFPEEMLANTFIRTLSISAVGSNLWIIDKDLPYADPEAGVSSGNLQGWQGGVMPSVRTFGLSANLQF